MSNSAASNRLYNFSAGPAVLPVSVLEQVRDELLCLPGVGASILEISHRSKAFDAILERTIADLRTLLSIPENYEVLFLQGGSRLQFSMIPMNLLRDSGMRADYVVTGTWGQSALVEAVKEGPTQVLWDGKSTNFSTLPDWASLTPSSDSAYVHFTSNETIQGVQFQSEPPAAWKAPVVCDVSSDFLSRPIDVARYGLIYACAQKNAGPAGVTVVNIRKDLLERGKTSRATCSSAIMPKAIPATTPSRLLPFTWSAWLFAGCSRKSADWQRWPSSIKRKRRCSTS